MRTNPISAFVITFNEEANLSRCLKSLSFCDEIVVIDSHSSDRTQEIAREHGAKVIERDWPGYVAQKAFGLSQVSYDWVLNLDADEEVSPQLRASIEQVIEVEVPADLAGYEVNRLVYHFGRWWRNGGWYPEYRLRLFRRDKVTWGGRDPHERPIPSGKVLALSGDLYHYTYRDLSDQLERLHKFSSIAAQEAFSRGKRCSCWQIVVNPIVRLVKFYIVKQGFREGMAGIVVAGAEAFYTFMKYAKLWELERSAGDAEDSQGGC